MYSGSLHLVKQRAILTFLLESEVISILETHLLIKKTPKTITRRVHLLERLASVREHGGAFDSD